MPSMERRSFLAAAISAFPAALLAQSARNPAPGKAVRVPSGQDRFGEHRNIGLSTTTYKVASQDTGGALFLFEHSNTRKGGPPRHLHHNEEEWFYVLEGAYVVEVGSERFDLKAGDSVIAPREVPHVWAFVGDTPGRMLVGFAPANQMEDFFLENAKNRKTGTYSTDAKVYQAHGMELLGPPLSVG